MNEFATWRPTRNIARLLIGRVFLVAKIQEYGRTANSRFFRPVLLAALFLGQRVVLTISSFMLTTRSVGPRHVGSSSCGEILRRL